jgi:hypothetical protein
MSNEEGKSTAGAFDPAAVAQAQLEKLAIQEKKQEILKQIAATLGNNLEVAKQQIELDRIRLSSAESYLQKLKDQKDADLNTIENQTAIKDQLDKILKNQKLSTAQQAELQALRDQENVSLDQALEKIQKFRSQQEISKDFASDIASGTAKLARNMGIAADFSKTAAGKFTEMGAKFFSGDRAANSKAIMGAISGMTSPMNILASVLDIAVKKMLELNKAAVGLKVATGYSNDFQSRMTAVAATTSKAGVTLEASNAAFTSLTKGITGFNLESDTFQENLGKSASLMTKLGVSADTSTKNFNLLLKTFKMTDTDTTRMMESMAAGAEQLGMTAEDLGKEFNSAMGYLSSFGKEGIKAFEDLAAQAAVSGLAIEKLIGMTKGFDKFGEGAKKAATMNAVLGTSLSSMALMAMNPAERMKELRNQINMATGGVDQMTQAQKLFTAEAMGYSSVAEMMADLQASPAEMRERAENAKQQADIQERLNRAMTELLPVGQQLAMAFEAIATNESFINFISLSIKVVSFLADNLFELLAAVGLVTAAIKLNSIAAAFNAAQLALIEIQLGAMIFLENVRNVGLLRAIGLTNLFTLSNIGLNAQLAISSLKILLIAGALYLLYKAFTKRGSPMLYIMPFFMAAGIFLMGKALDTMGLKAIVAALALAVLAGGIALVFYGIAAAVTAITGFFSVMINNVKSLPAVAGGLFLIGAGFIFLGTAALLGSYGILAGLGALTVMLALFKLTGTSMEDMFGAGEEVLKIGTGVLNLGQGLAALKSAISDIKKNLGEESLFAATLEGDTTSLVMGSGVAVGKLFKNNKIEVEVKMPEVSVPKISVNVFIGNEELKTLIRQEVVRNKS